MTRVTSKRKCVRVEGRLIKKLTIYECLDGTVNVILDGRFSVNAKPELADQIAWLAAHALAIGSGLSHAGERRTKTLDSLATPSPLSSEQRERERKVVDAACRRRDLDRASCMVGSRTPEFEQKMRESWHELDVAVSALFPDKAYASDAKEPDQS